MPETWQPIDTLPRGHYAAGLCSDGSEHGLFFDGQVLWNVATGERAPGVTHWQRGTGKKPPQLMS